jgi:AraC-like DNA-binding protein
VRRVFDDAFGCASRDKMACETAILRLVARLGVHSTDRAKNDGGPTASIRRARERIDDDPAAALTLVQLANEVGLSRYQLIRGFARELGLTPHAYVLQRRIALARRLIRAGRPLAEAALAAGFCDQSHLNRCFIRQLGVTPSRYASNSA